MNTVNSAYIVPSGAQIGQVMNSHMSPNQIFLTPPTQANAQASSAEKSPKSDSCLDAWLCGFSFCCLSACCAGSAVGKWQAVEAVQSKDGVDGCCEWCLVLSFL